MKTLIRRFRRHMPTLTGAALLMLMVDGFILLYRLLGLSRSVAVYAGLLTFVLFGALLARRVFVAQSTTDLPEDTHA